VNLLIIIPEELYKFKLEYGYYGGCSVHLGAYSYRGFDIVIGSEYGDTLVEGLTYTLGIYEEGCDETDHLFDIENFSFDNATREVDRSIDWILAHGYKHPDDMVRQMRVLLKKTHDMETRSLIEKAIEEREKGLRE